MRKERSWYADTVNTLQLSEKTTAFSEVLLSTYGWVRVQMLRPDITGLAGMRVALRRGFHDWVLQTIGG